MERKFAIQLRNVVTRLPELRFEEPVNWNIEEGQQWAVVGPNGAGKSLLADLIQRRYALKEGEICYGCEGSSLGWVQSIAFKDIYSLADCRNSYYQQRWHATEADEMPVVADLLEGVASEEEACEMLAHFGIEELLSKKIIYLSSGELRKFLIARMLLKRPRVLILDNPFIGLDIASRRLLVEMLERITRLDGVQVVLLLANPDEIPEMVTHILPVKQRRCLPVFSREEFMEQSELIEGLFPSGKAFTLPLFSSEKVATHIVTFRMEKVSIKYGNRIILKELDWEVKNGEKWALFGPNGAGKSTLLSLIYADNPQSYANTFYLFDRKRGSGESIWDIKKRIGYVSPEMHLYYMENVPALRIVGSGFFDSIGLYQKCTEQQQEVALAWMRLLGIENLKERSFLTLSSGEQRLVLLARVFVKDPDLVILDEPLHGLDVGRKKRVVAIIEQFCARPGKTLIYVTHYPHELPPCVDKTFELVKQH